MFHHFFVFLSPLLGTKSEKCVAACSTGPGAWRSGSVGTSYKSSRSEFNSPCFKKKKKECSLRAPKNTCERNSLSLAGRISGARIDGKDCPYSSLQGYDWPIIAPPRSATAHSFLRIFFPITVD